MENEQIEYTVEYQDGYGVLYFENIKASDLSDAKMQIRQRFPDVTIRAVTVVPHNNRDEQP
ncbi:hypothetical protein ACFPPD_19465 [Cohnella suwonensis]|uniref:Uncharacterized protein n=1 Tax=Cohnella suwonensis TaxID=696072 RepID=A0ABW0M1J6_9BACL